MSFESKFNKSLESFFPKITQIINKLPKFLQTQILYHCTRELLDNHGIFQETYRENIQTFEETLIEKLRFTEWLK